MPTVVVQTQKQELRVPLMLAKEHAAKHRIASEPKDEVIDGAEGALEAARDAAEKLIKIANAYRTNELEPVMAREMKVLKSAEPAAEIVATRFDHVRKFISTHVEINERTMTPPRPKDAGEVAVMADIRRALSGMTHERRAEVIKSTDPRTVGAICEAPAWVSGMTENEVAVLKATYQKRWHADLFDRNARYQRVLDALERGRRSFNAFIFGGTSSDGIVDWAALKRMQEAAKQADEAA